MDESLWTKKTIEKGEVLFLEGDLADNIYFIKEGIIKVFVLTSSGREKILALLGAGDFLGEMAIIDDQPRSATAQALEKSQVMVLNKDSFCTQIKKDPLLAYKIIQMLVSRLRQTDQQLMFQVSKSAYHKVGKGILDLAEKYGQNVDKGLLISLRITHQDLASFSGVARETATRVLQHFINQGLLTINRNYLLIKDLEKFRDIVME